MTNGAPRTIRGYIVCHADGQPYYDSFRATEKDAVRAFCVYWAGLARVAGLGPDGKPQCEAPRRWSHFYGQGFRVGVLMGPIIVVEEKR